ncbi:MAG: hypothetical protein NZ811_08945, partial [Gammaproteobacteria bacterium]|nr:hypothetical protein [Gammaproteobacteria bacterium]
EESTMRIINVFFATIWAVLMVGCAATPHIFQYEWTEEKLPQLTSIEGDNSITGSAFLRQGGGGIVNCAGNDVLLIKQNRIARSAYAREVNSLGYSVRNASAVDPKHTQFEEQLRRLNASQSKRTSCDVDGKFQFSNVAPGDYIIKTKVYWVVANEGQGGILGKRITIPSNSSGDTYNNVISEVTSRCGIYGSCLVR